MWTVELGRLAVCIQRSVLRTALFLWNAQWLFQSDLTGKKKIKFFHTEISNFLLSVVQLDKLHPTTPTWCLRLKTVTCLPLATANLHLRRRGFTGEASSATERLHWRRGGFTGEASSATKGLHWRRRGFTGNGEVSLAKERLHWPLIFDSNSGFDACIFGSLTRERGTADEDCALF